MGHWDLRRKVPFNHPLLDQEAEAEASSGGGKMWCCNLINNMWRIYQYLSSIYILETNAAFTSLCIHKCIRIIEARLWHSTPSRSFFPGGCPPSGSSSRCQHWNGGESLIDGNPNEKTVIRRLQLWGTMTCSNHSFLKFLGVISYTYLKA